MTNLEFKIQEVRVELSDEKIRLANMVKAAVEMFYSNTELIPKIEVFKPQRETKSACGTFSENIPIEVKITVEI
jgi:hypothetical protein